MNFPEKLHEALAPISWLAGRWVTAKGCGIYPTIENFTYNETLEFTCIGQPMFNYMSTSKNPEKNIPLHQERGFLRIKPGTNELALIVSHNFGLTTLEEGVCDLEKKEIKLKSSEVSRISFAKHPHVLSLARNIKLISPNCLEVVISMQTENTDMTEHLRAVYFKQD